jgi:hypothetical protein
MNGGKIYAVNMDGYPVPWLTLAAQNFVRSVEPVPAPEELVELLARVERAETQSRYNRALLRDERRHRASAMKALKKVAKQRDMHATRAERVDAEWDRIVAETDRQLREVTEALAIQTQKNDDLEKHVALMQEQVEELKMQLDITETCARIDRDSNMHEAASIALSMLVDKHEGAVITEEFLQQVMAAAYRELAVKG